MAHPSHQKIPQEKFTQRFHQKFSQKIIKKNLLKSSHKKHLGFSSPVGHIPAGDGRQNRVELHPDHDYDDNCDNYCDERDQDQTFVNFDDNDDDCDDQDQERWLRNEGEGNSDCA